jgi:uncharacterized protein YhaN
MKLRSCHIDNFGKLSDLHLEFQDGVNLFHEPNAWGKSTLAAFLRVMFYGFDSKRESGLFDKERVVFRPWQGGTYGGELDFSYQGKEYRISRKLAMNRFVMTKFLEGLDVVAPGRYVFKGENMLRTLRMSLLYKK